ncbi:unnamed protein product [Allacma fusca]|uniref:G-protein coupled receptors family 1 profile domain-containing protein n=1 Tax=Allacma fusca TaxID=39272 RepID=A0A8J2M8U3_9HEXA|nr:unnamed protein product [Allacma fusca]
METTEYYNESDFSTDIYLNGTSPGLRFDSNYTLDYARNYCGAGWTRFQYTYGSVHGYFSLVVCFFGCLANLLNLIVLTRKAMISPTNAILTGLALADLLNMIEYIPFAVYRLYVHRRYPYGWAVFILVHSNFSQVCHTIAIWLTLTLAVWRYIAVGQPQRCKELCTMVRAKWAIASAYLFSPLVCTPVYFSFSISSITIPRSENETESSTKYFVNMSQSARAYNGLLEKINFWIYG